LPPGGSVVAPTPVMLRTRCRDFAGIFVMRCHSLAHEDVGVRQIVEVI